MSAPDRMTRVNELLKREIANIIERERFRAGNSLVSVTAVSVSHDLRLATVKISIFGGDDDAKQGIINTLQGMHADIQKKISNRITLKYTPVLSFELDLNIERGDRVLAMIEELDNESE